MEDNYYASFTEDELEERMRILEDYEKLQNDS